MKNKSLLLIVIFVFALFAIANKDAIAKDQSLHTQKYQNLCDMSAKLGDISAQLSTGKMTPQAQKNAAKITQEISRRLQDKDFLGNGSYHAHQVENQKMKMYWNRNPFPVESPMHG